MVSLCPVSGLSKQKKPKQTNPVGADFSMCYTLMFVLSIISCCVNGSRLISIALMASSDFLVLITCLSYREHSFCICHPFKLEVHPALFPLFYSPSSSSCPCLFSSRDAQPFSPMAVNHLFSPSPSLERENTCSQKVVYAKCSSSPSLFEPGQCWTSWFALQKWGLPLVIQKCEV